MLFEVEVQRCSICSDSGVHDGAGRSPFTDITTDVERCHMTMCGAARARVSTPTPLAPTCAGKSMRVRRGRRRVTRRRAGAPDALVARTVGRLGLFPPSSSSKPGRERPGRQSTHITPRACASVLQPFGASQRSLCDACVPSATCSGMMLGRHPWTGLRVARDVFSEGAIAACASAGVQHTTSHTAWSPAGQI